MVFQWVFMSVFGFVLVCIAVAVVMGSVGHGYIEGDVNGYTPGRPEPFPFDLGDVVVTRTARRLLTVGTDQEGRPLPRMMTIADHSGDRWWKFWRGFMRPEGMDVSVRDYFLYLHSNGLWDHPASRLTDGQRAWNHNVVCSRFHSISDPPDHDDPRFRAQQSAAPWRTGVPIIGVFGRGDELLYVVTRTEPVTDHDPDTGVNTVRMVTTTTVATTPPIVDPVKVPPVVIPA